ncbi:MAG: ABC transporter ATP-binding protein [Cyclobacteriaceae bacterium]
MSLIVTKNLTTGYSTSKSKTILSEKVNVNLKKGEVVGLMGQNGVGKTTFLKTVAGILKPIDGTVEVGGVDVTVMPKPELARRLSIVLTEKPAAGNLSVLELIAIGRYPYSHWLGILNNKDREVIEWALSITNTNYLANRKLGELSDGQLQKVMIARALAQETGIILLDEPGSHLDMSNKIELVKLLKKISDAGKGVLISTHDIFLATELATELWLFDFQKPVICGCPEDLILNGSLSEALYLGHHNYDFVHGGFEDLGADDSTLSIRFEGDENVIYWLRKACKRNRISEDVNASITVKCKDEFDIVEGGESTKVSSIAQVLSLLKTRIDS